MNIYEMEQEYLRLSELFETLEDMKAAGEDVKDFQAETVQYFVQLKGNLFEKIESIAKLICNLEAQQAAQDAEVLRLKEKSKRIEKKVAYLKENLIRPALEMLDGKKAVGSLFTVSLRRSESVEILDEIAIPEEYKKTKIILTINKVGVKQGIKAGKKIDGAKIVENQSVQIK